MNWADEFKKRFGGFWNTLFLISGLVICLRFAGAEWKDRELQERLLFALYLVLSIVGSGILWGAITTFLKRFKRTTYSTPNAPVDFIGGMKYGVTAAIIVIFTVGLLMVDNYLGPMKEPFDVAIKKISERIP